MFFINFSERTTAFDLHEKDGDKFKQITYEYDSKGFANSGFPAHVVKRVNIFGYTARENKELIQNTNVYFNDYYAITEVPDETANHLLAEWEKSSPLFASKLIMVAKKQHEAEAIARDKIGNNPSAINTGSRPLEINTSFNSIKGFKTEQTIV